MKVTLKLYAMLGQYLPSDANQNEAEIDLVEGESILDIIEKFSVPQDQCHLVLVNGTYVEPSARGEYKLDVNDHLAIWPPVAGG